MLAVLEFISLMNGVNVSKNEIFWTSYGKLGFDYTQHFGENEYRLVLENGIAKAYIGKESVFEAIGDFRIKTDMHGNIVSVFGIDSEKSNVTVKYKGREYEAELLPNEELAIGGDGLYTVNKVPFR